MKKLSTTALQLHTPKNKVFFIDHYVFYRTITIIIEDFSSRIRLPFQVIHHLVFQASFERSYEH